MGIIKYLPEDFLVTEISRITAQQDGRYTLYLLEKRDYTTMKALEIIARKMGKPLREIGFAGNKDKRAITVQTISVLRGGKIPPKLPDGLKLTFMGRLGKPISLGDLEGNRFRIVVRDLDADTSINESHYFPNLFGEQRFSRQNVVIGRCLIKQEFRRALQLIRQHSPYKERIDASIKRDTNDYVGALSLVPRKLLMLYVHSVQSDLWNRAVMRALGNDSEYRKFKGEQLAIPGFGVKIGGLFGEQLSRVMDEENISIRDFIIHSMPELSSEGAQRRIVEEVKYLKTTVGIDEFFRRKKKVTFMFKLAAGAYATTALSFLLNEKPRTYTPRALNTD
jgi:tRNA pseudouridine13 synthase